MQTCSDWIEKNQDPSLCCFQETPVKQEYFLPKQTEVGIAI